MNERKQIKGKREEMKIKGLAKTGIKDAKES